MSEEIVKNRNIPFSLRIWDALDAEAKANKRSAVKQLEAILRERYGLDATAGSENLQAVLADMRRRMDEFEASIRPLIEVPERRPIDPEPKKTKAKSPK